MSDSATSILHRAAGLSAHGAPGLCAVCGHSSEATLPAADAIASSFASFSDLAAPSSPSVCVGCAWAMAGKPPHTLRMWTVVWRADHPAPPSATKAPDLGPDIHLTSRADMRAVVDLLTTSPACEWICAVSLSGQKHVVPFARVNRGAKWAVRMEGADVASDARAFAALLAPAARLRLAGFSSTDIQTGEPPFVRLRGDALATWRMEWPALAPHRSSHLLELVLSCITKEHAHEVLIKAEAAL